MTAGRGGRAGLGRRRRGLRHRRRLRRSSELRHGPAGPGAGGRGLSRGHPQPARLALVRAVADVRPAAAVLRRQRRQHGLDDQPLHGQPEGPQRRRLQPRRRRSAGGPTGRRWPIASGPARRIKGVPIIAGGVEASLRRLAHYDYWSDKVRRSILLDAKADLLVFGMGERPLVEIVRRLAAGETVDELRDMRGVAYRLGASEARRCASADGLRRTTDRVLPSYEEVSTDKRAFAEMTRIDPSRDQPVQRPAAGAVSRPRGGGGQSAGAAAGAGGDGPRLRPAVHAAAAPELRPTSRSRPSRWCKDSIQIMRGCFGGCTFCSITAHEGRIIQSRSAGVDPGRDPPHGRATRSSRARSATSAARRPTCTR